MTKHLAMTLVMRMLMPVLLLLLLLRLLLLMMMMIARRCSGSLCQRRRIVLRCDRGAQARHCT
jgi:hypothetical protein